METLEGSTLELLHRRRVRTFYPGYTMILLLAGILVSLPLVKVDVVATATGMIRSSSEPLDLLPGRSGIVEECRLDEFRQVNSGDTLLQLSTALPLARLEELEDVESYNLLHINDIQAILKEKDKLRTTRFRQALLMHRTACRSLEVRRDFQKEEYLLSQGLYQEEVIPLREYEQALSRFRLADIELEDHKESFRSSLEDESMHLERENHRLRAEIEEIKAGLPSYYVLAPSGGVLRQCSGIRKGSVVQAGSRVASIVAPGSLLAECYVDSRYMDRISTGMKVRIRLEGNGPNARSWLSTRVEELDVDVLILEGRPVYRIRCPLEEPMWKQADLPPRTGMRFTAAVELDRCSLSALLLEKLNRNFHPVLASGVRDKK